MCYGSFSLRSSDFGGRSATSPHSVMLADYRLSGQAAAYSIWERGNGRLNAVSKANRLSSSPHCLYPLLLFTSICCALSNKIIIPCPRVCVFIMFICALLIVPLTIFYYSARTTSASFDERACNIMAVGFITAWSKSEIFNSHSASRSGKSMWEVDSNIKAPKE